MAGALLLLDVVFWFFCESAAAVGRELPFTVVVNVFVPENRLWLLRFPIEPRMSWPICSISDQTGPENTVLSNKRLCGSAEAESSVRTSSCSTPQLRLNCRRRRARAVGRRTGRDRDKTWSQFEISTRRTFTERGESHACQIDKRLCNGPPETAATITASSSRPDNGI